MTFDDFWKSYPRRIAKIIARKAWDQMLRQGHKPEEIIAGAVCWAELCRVRGTEPQFIPHPSSWLRAGRWEDDELREYQPIDPVAAAEAKDRADRLLKRGQYRTDLN